MAAMDAKRWVRSLLLVSAGEGLEDDIHRFLFWRPRLRSILLSMAQTGLLLGSGMQIALRRGPGPLWKKKCLICLFCPHNSISG